MPTSLKLRDCPPGSLFFSGSLDVDSIQRCEKLILETLRAGLPDHCWMITAKVTVEILAFAPEMTGGGS